MSLLTVTDYQAFAVTRQTTDMNAFPEGMESETSLLKALHHFLCYVKIYS